MSPAGLAVCIALAFAGLAALSLSMDRHHRVVLSGPVPAGRRRTLRLVGWMAIGLSFTAAVALDGWNFGLVQATGALTAAALGVALLLSYRPGWLRMAAMAALPVAVMCWIFARDM